MEGDVGVAENSPVRVWVLRLKPVPPVWLPARRPDLQRPPGHLLLGLLRIRRLAEVALQLLHHGRHAFTNG